MNTITIISAVLLLSSLVAAQEAYAPAQFSQPQWRQERQTGAVEAQPEVNWLTKLLRGGWWTWDR